MSTSCHSNKGNSCHCTKVPPDGGVSQNKAHSPLFPSKGGLLAYQHSWKEFCSCPSSGGHPNHIMRVKPAGARLNFTQSRCILLPHLQLTQAHKEMLFWTISTRFFSELHCPLPWPSTLLPFYQKFVSVMHFWPVTWNSLVVPVSYWCGFTKGLLW